VAVNQIVVYRPGRMSALMRNAGTYKSWMTSSDVIVSFTARPTGTWSSSISRWPPSCWNLNIHCFATTYTSSASGGGDPIEK
jgi:hypothetical protein